MLHCPRMIIEDNAHVRMSCLSCNSDVPWQLANLVNEIKGIYIFFRSLSIVHIL